MAERPEAVRADANGHLTTLGACLPRVAAHFTRSGALGVVVVDAAALGGIEVAYGGEALRHVVDQLGALVADVAADGLGIDDLVVGGETGRCEIVVLIFREASEVDFYRRELPELRRLVADGIARRGNRVAYPWLKQIPPLPVGTGASLRNPTITAETQLRAALTEARQE